MTKIILGERPDRPEGTGALGLTAAVELSNGVWHQKPEDRTTISEVLALLNSTWVPPLIRVQMIGVLTAEP